MKALTISKLELQAALLAARLRNEVQRALTLQIDRTFMWTDSTTVLQWLHSFQKQPVFVANRVAEVLELTTADEWYHVQSAENPADAGNRGLSAKTLLQSSWLKDPEFLKTDQWPFKPSEDFRLKLKQVKPDPTDELVAESSSMLSGTMLQLQKLSSGRSIPHTRISCALQPMFCGSYRRTAFTGPTQVPLWMRPKLKKTNNIIST